MPETWAVAASAAGGAYVGELMLVSSGDWLWLPGTLGRGSYETLTGRSAAHRRRPRAYPVWPWRDGTDDACAARRHGAALPRGARRGARRGRRPADSPASCARRGASLESRGSPPPH